jgi:hypothetical protein
LFGDLFDKLLLGLLLPLLLLPPYGPAAVIT